MKGARVWNMFHILNPELPSILLLLKSASAPARRLKAAGTMSEGGKKVRKYLRRLLGNRRQSLPEILPGDKGGTRDIAAPATETENANLLLKENRARQLSPRITRFTRK